MSAAIDLVMGVAEGVSYLLDNDVPRLRNFGLWVFAGSVCGALSTAHAAPAPTLVSTVLWLGVPTGVGAACVFGAGAAIVQEPRIAHVFYGLGFGLTFALCRHALLFG